MLKPVILAVYFDGDIGILTFETEQEALNHMAWEVSCFYADEANSPVYFTTQAQVWEEINREAIPLNFKILDQRESDRVLF